MKLDPDKEEIKSQVERNVRFLYRRNLADATCEQIYFAFAYVVRDLLMKEWIDSHKTIEDSSAKKLYYLSMEFLPGRTLGTIMINMKAYQPLSEAMEELGIDINVLEDQERDPALGNGGLGRLAACFLDSLATLSYPAYGCGIRYRYGLFRQKTVNGYQVELPDSWLKNGYPFEVRRSEYICEVRFNGHVETVRENGRDLYELKNYFPVRAVPYDIPVVGYGCGCINTLRVWDAEPVEEFSLNEFDRGNYLKAVEQANFASNICSVLYPDDSCAEGRELRLKQQYFFVSATVQTALRKFSESHDDIHKLPEFVAFHMNDTHPALCVPELMRILLDEYRLFWDESWEIVKNTCAFTNHTVMPEALEEWPAALLEKLLPRIYQIVLEISRRLKEFVLLNYPDMNTLSDETEIVHDGTVRMADLAIAGSHSVNGVAEIHSEILKKKTFKGFYFLDPGKFNNKTNGINQRRFMLHANPLLSEWITERIGEGWITDLSKLRNLLNYADDERSLMEVAEIKYKNKQRLAAYIRKSNGTDVDPESIFDVQVKRLHEYKRQLMNILHVMYLYNRIKDDPDFDIYPHTFIFGAKAAPGYHRAKLIIKLINSVAEVINNDPDVNGKIKAVFIEDYCVSNAELIIPAADISEQISTASKEASGTSNMKFMLNGAVTLGTMDGANIEIAERVGAENFFRFGLSAGEVMRHEELKDYDPRSIAETFPELKRVLMQLTDGTFSSHDPELFREIRDSLLSENTSQDTTPDPYFILADFGDYLRACGEADHKYRDRYSWARSALINIAESGKFSSDRTIEEYVNEIWHLKKVSIE